MTTYANAAPPHSALFDDAPTAEAAQKYASTFGVSVEHARMLVEGATLQPQRAHVTPAVRIAKDNKGQWFGLPVAMQYGAPVPLALALKRVEIGRTVFVAPGDADAVLKAVGGTNGENPAV